MIWMNEEIDLIRLLGGCFHPNGVSLPQRACDQLQLVHSKPRFGLAEEVEKGVELNELAEIVRKGQDDFVFVVSEVSALQITKPGANPDVARIDLMIHRLQNHEKRLE